MSSVIFTFNNLLTFMPTEGQLLRNYIENKKLSKSQVASDLSMSRQNLYNLFETVKLELDTKTKFVNYFKRDIFLEKGLEPEDKKHPDPKRSQDEFAISEQSINNLTECNRKAIEAVDKIADSNLILSRLLEKKFIESGRSEIPAALESKFEKILVYIAQASFQKERWNSPEEALEAMSNDLFAPEPDKSAATGIHSKVDKERISNS